jgi:Arc/MetJ-type ribon-helix-helix transcriptional regulator
MYLQLTPGQKALARLAIETGRIHSEEEAVEQALALWEARERDREEILALLDEAEASLALGHGRLITEESRRQLAAEVRQRGRASLAVEHIHRQA